MNKQIAIITGASSGIGEACAELLAEQNFNIVLCGRRKEKLMQLSDKLKSKFQVEIKVLDFDIRNRDAVANAVGSLEYPWNQADVLINNAGLAMGLSAIENGNIDHWDTMIDTNFKGLLYMSRNIIPLMIDAKKGHIINVGSIAGKEVYANGNVYCATKHAVDALNRSMRLDLSQYPIKVSAVNPGAVETEFSLVRFEGDAERAEKVYLGFENLIAKDVAEAVWFMINRPAHVNINDLTIMPTAQPMAGVIHRKN